MFFKYLVCMKKSSLWKYKNPLTNNQWLYFNFGNINKCEVARWNNFEGKNKIIINIMQLSLNYL